MESAILCCDKLHALGPQTVIITSTHTSENRDLINLIASYKSIDSSSQESFKFHIQFPKVGTGSFNGTGDLFAAVLLAR